MPSAYPFWVRVLVSCYQSNLNMDSKIAEKLGTEAKIGERGGRAGRATPGTMSRAPSSR
jgi:hypothetical protein